MNEHAVVVSQSIPMRAKSARRLSIQNQWFGGVRVLMVGGSESLRAMVRQASGERGTVFHLDRCGGYASHIRQGTVDIILRVLDANEKCSEWERKLLRIASHQASVAIAVDRPRREHYEMVVHDGLLSVVDTTLPAADQLQSIREKLARALSARQQRRRLLVLEAACKRLSKDRDALCAQVGSLHASMAQSRDEGETRVAEASLIAEYRTLLSIELELDAVLRTGLSAMLLRLGTANAALFFPEPNGTWRVIAYVRSSRTRAAVEGMLRTIADQFASAIAKSPRPITFQPNTMTPDWSELHGALFGWSAIAFPCVAGGTAQGVVVCFRDADRAFENAHVRNAQLLAPILGEALHKSSRVTNRLAS